VECVQNYAMCVILKKPPRTKDNCFYSLKYLDKLTMLALCSQHVLSAVSLNHLT